MIGFSAKLMIGGTALNAGYFEIVLLLLRIAFNAPSKLVVCDFAGKFYVGVG